MAISLYNCRECGRIVEAERGKVNWTFSNLGCRERNCPVRKLIKEDNGAVWRWIGISMIVALVSFVVLVFSLIQDPNDPVLCGTSGTGRKIFAPPHSTRADCTRIFARGADRAQ